MNKKIKSIIRNNIGVLENSKMDFEAIFNVMFANSGVLAEDTDGFRIRSYSYEQIKERIESASEALYAKIGATHGFVALEMENCIDWIVAFWAILRSGNKPYLVNCRQLPGMANSALKTLGIKYTVGKGDTKLDTEFIDIDSLEGKTGFEGEFENEIALSTSGTSLKETICFYSGQRFSSQILNVKSFMKKYPEIAADHNGRIKNLAFLPFYHIFGLIAVYFWFSFFGVTIVFLKDYSSDTILKTCKKHEVTHVFAVPLLWHTIENSVMKKAKEAGDKKLAKLKRGIRLYTGLQNIFPHLGMKLSQKIMSEVTDELFGKSIKFCISGGSYVRSSALELINAIGYNLHNGYGMTEIGITSVELRTRPKHKNLNSIGKPFASVDYEIGDKGTLLIKGDSLCDKMLINGREQSMDGYFDSGDILTQNDGYYYVKGRNGDTIIGDNGENINPDVVEQCFALPQAENFCVLGIENEGKKTVSMIVQIGKYMSVSKRNELLDTIIAINESLPLTSRVAKIYYTTDNITSPGAAKISRTYVLKALADKTVNIYDFTKAVLSDCSEAVYNSEILAKVKSIVAKRLNTDAESIDIHAHIMLDMGADSMQYFSILTDLAEEFSVSASEKDVLCYTVHEICQYIERHI